jgi:tetratricopeptide (TPR) repeat protein/tRNA A-37 threonylcarbamoyl transferase component Bud32
MDPSESDSTLVSADATVGGPDAPRPADPWSTETLAAGASIGRYVVLEKVGEGAMGVVYAAYDPQLDRKVALKLVRPAPGASEVHAAARRARLVREAQALARVSHPNVVAVHDAGVLHDRVFVAMEFVEGQTLVQWRRAVPRTPEQILDKLLRAAEGLAAAHEKDLVHRDVKPSNIMVATDGRVRVMDFGLVRAAGTLETDREPAESGRAEEGGLGPDLTRAGAAIGTPAYMPPEQYIGIAVDARSDQFSWCVTAWESLFGQLPFAGDDAMSIAAAVSVGTRRPAPEDAKVPGWLRRTLDRGLSAEPSARWPDMRALIDAVAHAQRRSRRRPWMLAGGAATLAVALGITWRVSQGRAEQARCRVAAASIADVWPGEGGTVAKDLLGVMSATGSAAASDTFAQTDRWLRAWASGWSDARGQTCRAAAAEAWTPQMLARAEDCLTESRLEAHELVTELLSAQERALVYGATAATRLRPADRCADLEHLRLRPTVPEGADEQLARTRALLSRIVAKRDSGAPTPAFAGLAARAVEEAEALDWKPLIGEARLALADVRERANEVAEAEGLYVQVFRDAGGDDDPQHAFTAANSLCRLVGGQPRRGGEGLVWCHAAEMALARVWDPAGLQEIEWMLSVSEVRYATGDREGAERLLLEALAQQTSALSVADGRLAATHDRLAKHAEARGDLDEATQHLVEARGILEQGVGRGHPLIADSINNFGVLYAARGDWSRAGPAFEEALAIREAAFGPDHPQTGQSLVNVGVVQLYSGHYEDACRTLERAVDVLERAEGGDSPRLIEALLGLGSALYDGNADDDAARHERAAEVTLRALELAEGSEGAKADVPLVLYSLSRIRGTQGRHEEEAALLERSVTTCEAAFGADSPGCAPQMAALGDVTFERGDLVAARRWYGRTIELLSGTELQADVRVNAGFGLARALPDDPESRTRARALATGALEAARGLEGQPGVRRPARIQQWLDDHPATD